MLISIIIPSFNQGDFIGTTIESILNQSYKEFEIIVMDGGSTDNTIDVLKSFGDNIQWVSKKDNGQSDAINKGIEKANGNIITFLNSDDYYLPSTFESVVEAFNKNKKAKWLTGDYIIVDENDQRIQNFIIVYKKIFRKQINKYILSVLNPIIQPSTFLTRELIQEIGVFDESLHYTMDYEYWLRAIQKYSPIVLTAKLSAFRIHSNSKGKLYFKKQFSEELNVAKKYQKNWILILMHRIHNYFILFFYKIIK